MVEFQGTSHQNVVKRVGHLPVVSSTYGMVSNVYSITKGIHPYIGSVCEAAEVGIWRVTSAALETASPIIGKLEPQIAMANDLACKSLDKIEQSLPLLQRPFEQNLYVRIVSNAKGVVTGAKDAVSGTLSSVVEAVQYRMERTGAAVSGGMDLALSTSEGLVEHYLPRADEDDNLELEAKAVKGADNKELSHYAHLASLSAKIRTRASARALAAMRAGKRRGLKYIPDLNSAANVVIESRTFVLARSLAERLQTTCLVLVSGLQGFPGHIQEKSRSTMRFYVTIGAPDVIPTDYRVQLGKMKESVDGVMDYLINNTALNWLVGPFYPCMPMEVEHVNNSSDQLVKEEPVEVEMELLVTNQQH
uniref:perilipin-2 n=1 Tax=Doryrhamphus excisus TaxID=161450 RepID=UPI0025AE2CD2|nr:perilipin-2 [Doryrhamphus excisus]